MDISVYIDENEYFVDYKRKPDWKTTGIKYGEDFEPREHRIDIPATEVCVLRNDTWMELKLSHCIVYST